MAADILISDLTNGAIVSGKWVGTGIFDVLMAAVSDNISVQYEAGRITGTDYANVYLSSMQSVIAQSINYTLQEKEVEARIDGLDNDNVSKVQESEARRNLTNKQIEHVDEQINTERLQNKVDGLLVREMELKEDQVKLSKAASYAK